jgi:drug efflux transport system permease protein
VKLRRMRAVARKEMLHVLRDPRSLALAIATPMLLLVLFSSALTLDVDRVPVLVWDQCRTPASRDLIARFGGSRYFSLRGEASDYREIEESIDSGRALVGLVVPVEFARAVDSGRPAEVQLITDGSDSNTATIAMNYAEVVVQDWSQEAALREVRRSGRRSIEAPLELRPRVWFNADLESRNYIVPGLIGVILMVIAALLTSLTVAREWEDGTMEQLISTPVERSELILGKLAPYLAIGLLDVLVAMLTGAFLFHVPLRGSALLAFAIAALFLVGALSMGVLISVVARAQLLATQMAMLTSFVPAFLLSGFVYPISNMPEPIQVITYLVPARYLVILLRAIYLKGVGLEVLAPEATLLAVFSVVMVMIAISKLKKKLE